jgi:Tol biopolymer transport system component/DNA-binding winged helix-turn-helix (wHTH) protein
VAASNSSRRYRFGDLSLDTGRRRVRRGDDTIPLTALSFDLLRVLVEEAPNVVEHEQLASKAWGARRIVSPENLAKRVMLLRQALGDQADHCRYIEGVRGRGYRLIPDVHVESTPANGSAVSAPMRVDLSAPQTEPVDAAVPIAGFRYRFALAGVAVAAVVAVLIASALDWSRAPLPTLRVRAEIPAPGYTKQGLAISPDGKQVAYVAAVDGVSKIAVRSLDDGETRILSDTAGAVSPFWSADSRSLAFYSNGELKRIDASGGPSQTLAQDVATTMPGAWGRDGTILFATPDTDKRGFTMALARLSATGGAVTLLPGDPPRDGETVQLFPQFLPDGRHFIYSNTRRPTFAGTLRVGALDEPGNVPIMPIDRAAFYGSGFLLYRNETTLLAQRFDERALALRGDAMTLAEDVDGFSASENGVIVYDAPSRANASSAVSTRRLVWVDRAGRPLSEVETSLVYVLPELSPDGRGIAVTASGGDIWTIDAQRGSTTRLTFDVASDAATAWSPDGERIAFGSGRRGMPTEHSSIFQRAANGTGSEELLLEGTADENLLPTDWSRDGRYIVFLRGRRPTTDQRLDIWVLPTEDRKAYQLIASPFRKAAAHLSPDGRWLAYDTNETGVSQVIVVSFPDVTRRWAVSTRGGDHPRWRADGRELYYRSPEGDLMAVDVHAGEEFAFGAPHKLFAFKSSSVIPYNVADDGERFLIDEDLPSAQVTDAASSPEQRIHVIVNWTAGLSEGEGGDVTR